jgi:hypothetical protein
VPMGFVLLKHDDDTVVLRCESPEAVGGFYNVDRVPNPSAPEVLRRPQLPGEMGDVMPRIIAIIGVAGKSRIS